MNFDGVEAGNGTGPNSRDHAQSANRGDDVERSAAGDGCSGESYGKPAADADQRAGADVDGGAAPGGGVCCHRCGAALDGASASEFYAASANRLPQVPGIETR